MNSEWIWLSHITSVDTPAYGGGGAFSASPAKQLCCGDSCNTAEIAMSNHIGSHVDAPRHFIAGAKTVEQYSADDWIFENPLVIDLHPDVSQIIEPDDIERAIPDFENNADLVLLRTQEHAPRNDSEFYQLQPGFSPELRQYFQERFPGFVAIGLNAISISCIHHREVGRAAHREFLGHGIRIFEDLALFNIPSAWKLQKAIALPFRYADADGAPVTMMGDIVYEESGNF